MFEILGLLYGIGKDIKKYLAYTESQKIVDRKWLEESGFHRAMSERGYSLAWTTQEKLESRLLDGYEIAYQIDKVKKLKNKIVRKQGDILIGKKS